MIRSTGHVIDALKEHGLRVEVGDDFNLYGAYCLARLDGRPVSPLFDSATAMISEKSGFWVCAFDADDTLLHTQGVRLLDLDDVNLGQHFDQFRQLYLRHSDTSDAYAAHYRGPRSLSLIRGRVAFTGDVWSAPRVFNSESGREARMLLARLVLQILCQTWAPDHFVSLLDGRAASKGMHLQTGFTHCEPGAWVSGDESVIKEEYLLWMNRAEMLKFASGEPIVGARR